MRSAYAPILRIAPEGWLLIVLLLLAAFLAIESGAPLLAAFLALPAPLVARYTRDLDRHSPAKPRGVLAPVDGRVCFRRECHDPWLGREAIRLGIAVAPWSSYLLRAPVEGEVHSVPGAPRSVSRIRTDEGEDILIVVARGWLFGARPVWLPFGERLGQGKPCGLRRLALQIDVYLPAGSRVEVAPDQTIRCGETVLATLLRRTER